MGMAAAFWLAWQVLTRHGGEAEALPAIEVAKGEGDRETMNTGLPVVPVKLHNLVYKHSEDPLIAKYVQEGEGAG